MSKWKREASPADRKYGTGWCAQLDRCYVQDRKYVVMSRLLQTEIGTVEHVCIRNTDNSDITWSEKQRIKNELFGDRATAIEVYPKRSRLVDEVGMYHLWILPEGFELPFGISKDDKQGEYIGRTLMYE